MFRALSPTPRLGALIVLPGRESLEVHLRRDTLLPGGVLVRVAKSHVRSGRFEYFASSRDAEAVRLLADYVIERHYPERSNGFAALRRRLPRIWEGWRDV